MTKLYFVKTNAYDMIISDDGEYRRVFTNFTTDKTYKEDEDGNFHNFIIYWTPDDGEVAFEYDEAVDEEAESAYRAILATVEDDSSWEVFEESLEKLVENEEDVAEGDRAKIMAELTTNW